MLVVASGFDGWLAAQAGAAGVDVVGDRVGEGEVLLPVGLLRETAAVPFALAGADENHQAGGVAPVDGNGVFGEKAVDVCVAVQIDVQIERFAAGEIVLQRLKRAGVRVVHGRNFEIRIVVHDLHAVFHAQDGGQRRAEPDDAVARIARAPALGGDVLTVVVRLVCFAGVRVID